jgi:hypothetical protein
MGWTKTNKICTFSDVFATKKHTWTKTNKICTFSDVFATKKHTWTKTKNSRIYMDENDI